MKTVFLQKRFLRTTMEYDMCPIPEVYQLRYNFELNAITFCIHKKALNLLRSKNKLWRNFRNTIIKNLQEKFDLGEFFPPLKNQSWGFKKMISPLLIGSEKSQFSLAIPPYTAAFIQFEKEVTAAAANAVVLCTFLNHFDLNELDFTLDSERLIPITERQLLYVNCYMGRPNFSSCGMNGMYSGLITQAIKTDQGGVILKKVTQALQASFKTLEPDFSLSLGYSVYAIVQNEIYLNFELGNHVCLSSHGSLRKPTDLTNGYTVDMQNPDYIPYILIILSGVAALYDSVKEMTQTSTFV